MSKYLRIVMAMFLLFALSVVVVAQDEIIDEDEFFNDVERLVYVDPDPITISDQTSDGTIEAITDDSESYYGVVVTIEGQLVNFVSPRMFSMGEEDELFTNSFVLVVNNSNNDFSAGLVEGADIRVTGRVHPSHDVIMDGTDWAYTPFDEDAAVEDTDRMNMVSFAQRGYIPEEFGEHTIFEVLNIDSIEIIGYDDLLAVD